MPDPIHNPECFVSHMGLWLMEADRMERAVAAIKSGLRPVNQRAKPVPMAAGKVVNDPQGVWGDEILYVVTEAGIAMIEINGVMAKAAGKYANVSTVQVRRAMRAASADPDVLAIMLCMDSPGGTCAGTQQLADDVRAADAKKPVHAFIDDIGASAGYWVPSQARFISANRSALVGSLGTYMVVEDSSKKAEMEGVVVHKITTGPQKGAFVEGAPITPEQLAAAQTMVNDLNALFMRGVSEGRKLTMAQTEALFDGSVHIADKAKGVGLIDKVQSFEAAMVDLANVIATTPQPPDNARRMQLAKARR